MGVNDLWTLLAPCGRRISIESLEGKTLAIDASVWIVQLIKAMRDEDGQMTKNAHIIGTLNRILRLLYHRIRPVFVFDGKSPVLKLKTIKERRRLRQGAEDKAKVSAHQILIAELRRRRGDPKLVSPAIDQTVHVLPDFVIASSTSSSRSSIKDTSLLEDDKKIDWEDALSPRPSKGSGIDDELINSSDDETPWQLPESSEDLDVSVLASLPFFIRKDIIEEARRRERALKRSCYSSCAEDPSLYSQSQVANFLRGAAMNKRIYEAEKQCNNSNTSGILSETTSTAAVGGFLVSEPQASVSFSSLSFSSPSSSPQPHSDSTENKSREIVDITALSSSSATPLPNRDNGSSDREDVAWESEGEDCDANTPQNISTCGHLQTKEENEIVGSCAVSSALGALGSEGIKTGGHYGKYDDDLIDRKSLHEMQHATESIDIPTDACSLLLCSEDLEEDSSVPSLSSKLDHAAREVAGYSCEAEYVEGDACANNGKESILYCLRDDKGFGKLEEKEGNAISIPLAAQEECAEQFSQKDKLSDQSSTLIATMVRFEDFHSLQVNSDYIMNSAKESIAAGRRSAEAMTIEMRDDIINLLQAFDIDFIIAPFEAEAQCAVLEELGLVQGVVTTDSDAFLFGAKNVYRNIFSDKKYTEVYNITDIKAELGLQREDLIALACFLGSDYTEGVHGVGIVNALEIVRAFPMERPLDGLKEFKRWLESFDIDDFVATGKKRRKIASPQSDEKTISCDDKLAVFTEKHKNCRFQWKAPATFPDSSVLDAYLAPNVSRSLEAFAKNQPKLFRVREYCRRLGWTEQQMDMRIDPVLRRFAEKSSQSRIDSHFLTYSTNQRFASVASTRLQAAVSGLTGGKKLLVHVEERRQQRKRKNSGRGKSKVLSI